MKEYLPQPAHRKGTREEGKSRDPGTRKVCSPNLDGCRASNTQVKAVTRPSRIREACQGRGATRGVGKQVRTVLVMLSMDSVEIGGTAPITACYGRKSGQPRFGPPAARVRLTSISTSFAFHRLRSTRVVRGVMCRSMTAAPTSMAVDVMMIFGRSGTRKPASLYMGLSKTFMVMGLMWFEGSCGEVGAKLWLGWCLCVFVCDCAGSRMNVITSRLLSLYTYLFDEQQRETITSYHLHSNTT